MILKERLQNNYDFLRVFAALSVTFTHSFDLLNKSQNEVLTKLTNGRVNFSFVGLSIFFSISGYLVAKSAATSPSLKNYLWKRFLRIQPMLFVLCILTVFILGPGFSTFSLKEYFNNNNSWSYFRNILPLFGMQFTLPDVFLTNIKVAEVNGSLWTLVLEERLYLFLSLLFCIKQSKKIFFILIVAALNLIYLIKSLNFFDFDIPFMESFIGFYPLIFLNASVCFLLQIKFGKGKFIYLLISLAIIILAITFKPLSFLQLFAIPVFVIGIAHLKGAFNIAGKYGDFTYGIYIFSFPVQQIFIAKGMFLNSPYQLFFATLLTVIPMAVLSWHFIEKKMLTLRNRVK